MRFQTVKSALVDLLGDNADGNFRVIGYRGQSHDASESTGDNRTVQVFYTSGDFPASSSNRNGSKTHDMTFDIILTASSAAASADLAILANADSTARALTNAIENIQNAAEIADNAIDEMISLVWNVIMDARNANLGITAFTLSSRKIERITKDATPDKGGLVVKTAGLTLKVQAAEPVDGSTGVTATGSVTNSEIKISDDTVTSTGVV